MERALKVQRGKEQLVSAREIQSEFHGRVPWDVSFICPLCRQPLLPAAMASGMKQSPHFKHERNNDRAHECENYAKRYGYFSTYQRAPMPMFIRRSHVGSRPFIVQGGFRGLCRRDLETLEREGAKVKIGQKSYSVNAQRFGSGLTKLPFEDISLKCSSAVRLVGSSLDLLATWGYPEDARRAMVFRRDGDTEQGKRLKIGDTIPFETDLFLLAPEGEGERIRSSFGNARRVGTAGKRGAMSNLSVFEVRLTKYDPLWEQGEGYLSECGFEVADCGDEPELLWPPSLMGAGDMVPCFEASRCVFAADMGSASDGVLYVHTNSDTSEQVRTVPLLRVENGDSGFAILECAAKLSFITTRNWVFSSAVLLHSEDLALEEWLHEVDLGPRISIESGCWTFDMRYPCELVCYREGHGIQVFEAKADNQSFSCDEGAFDVVKIRKKLSASLDNLVVLEKTFGAKRSTAENPPMLDGGTVRLAPGLSGDYSFAAMRRNGGMGWRFGANKQRALQRETGRWG